MWNGKQGNSWRAFRASRCYQESSLVCLVGAPHCCGKHKIRLYTSSCTLSCLPAQGCWGSTRMFVGMHTLWAWDHVPHPQDQRDWPGSELLWLWTPCVAFQSVLQAVSGPSQHLPGSLMISACWAPQVAGAASLEKYLFLWPAAHGGIGYFCKQHKPPLACRAAAVFGNG